MANELNSLSIFISSSSTPPKLLSTTFTPPILNFPNTFIPKTAPKPKSERPNSPTILMPGLMNSPSFLLTKRRSVMVTGKPPTPCCGEAKAKVVLCVKKSDESLSNPKFSNFTSLRVNPKSCLFPGNIPKIPLSFPLKCVPFPPFRPMASCTNEF